LTSAEKYVTAAYLVVLAVVLLYVVLYAFKIARLERELAELAGTEADLERRRAIQHELEASRAAYEVHLAHAAGSPSAQLLGLTQPTIPEIQRRLPADEALLLFLAGPERLDAFAVRRDRVYHHQTGTGSRDLAVNVRVVRELMVRSPVDGGLTAALGQLHQSLVDPLLRQGALQGVRRIHIVPHGPLSALPFAALWNRSSARFLVQDFILDYLPAVAALADSTAKATIPLRGMAVFAPLPDSLPATLGEAKIIRRLLPDATVRFGSAATERGVRTALENGRPIHLASHGFQNGQNPLFSRMIVGRSTRSDPANDGRLELHEILQLETGSPLAFLSGCETGFSGAGADPFAPAMEEGSLAQALLIAGVHTVVATLWRVRDDEAGKTAGGFYRELLASGSPAEALALAQREAIRAGKGLSWAAYSVFGAGGRKLSVAVRATEETH
jgi:CHAT domain-containing protein